VAFVVNPPLSLFSYTKKMVSFSQLFYALSIISMIQSTYANDDLDDDSSASSSSGSSASSSSSRSQVFVHPLTNMPGSADGVETSFFYPKYANLKFPIGEVATVLCHFSNNDNIAYNVSAIMGSLNSPYDFAYHIQNYTYKPLGIVVRPGDEITFQYQFQVTVTDCPLLFFVS
jgi:hypothetical protein